MSTAYGNVWEIEEDGEYRDWLAAIQSRHPVGRSDIAFPKLAPGASSVARSSVFAEEREGSLVLGVTLNTGEEFRKPWPGTFRGLVAEAVASGRTLQGEVADLAAFETEHGQTARLEFVSSHVGGYVSAKAANGTVLFLDED